MRGRKGIFALALVVAALLVAGCGGDDKGKGIPPATAEQLYAQLDKVQARIDQGSPGACRDILEAPDSRGANKKQVEDTIDSMPDDVDADVKSALQDSFDHLWDLVEQECEDKADQQDTNTTPTDTQTQTDTTPTDTTPTDTTPTDTTPTDTTPTEPDTAPLPNDGNGNGGGNGGGAGPSGQEGGG